MQSNISRLMLAGLCLLCFLPAWGQDAAKTDSPAAKEAASVKKLFEAKFPGGPVTDVVKSPYFGLYEIQLDDQVVYTDAKVTYVMVGSIYDAGSKANLTTQRMRQLSRVSWDALPLDLAFKRVKGNGSRKLAIFSDADCPYCKKLETDMKGVDNVTIYTFLFPIDSLHPDSARKSSMIWCSDDRAKAWNEYFATGKLPNNKGECATPIEKTAQLGEKMHVNATPTLVFADGSVIPGALSAERIENELAQADAAVKKTAAAKK